MPPKCTPILGARQKKVFHSKSRNATEERDRTRNTDRGEAAEGESEESRDGRTRTDGRRLVLSPS